jgi:hypothetical protein
VILHRLLKNVQMHPLKGTLSRKKTSVNEVRTFNYLGSRKHNMFSDKSRGPHQHHCRRYLRFWSQLSLLYHAPIRIKASDFHRTREHEQSIRVPSDLRSLFSAHIHEARICDRVSLLASRVTPVRFADPDNRRFQTVSTGDQDSWLGASICLAHGVVSKDGGSDIYGAVTVDQSRRWLIQHLAWVPVTAQSGYPNILSSLNSTLSLMMKKAARANLWARALCATMALV